MITLDDAIIACEKLLSEQGVRGVYHDNISTFLSTLKAKAEPLFIKDDATGFILEAAMQKGFDTIDDDIELYVVSGAKLIEFVQLVQAHPVRMVLFCPACGVQHIDAAERAPLMYDQMQDAPKVWDNPPHRSHKCADCGHIWRPADTPTEGVRELESVGKNDNEPRIREHDGRIKP